MIPVVTPSAPDLASIENRLAILERGGVNNNIDNQSKDILGRIIEEKILDIVWDKYFHFFTWFEGAGEQSGTDTFGWQLDIGTGTTELSPSGVSLNSATTNDVSTLFMSRSNQDFMSFSQHSRFRTSIYLDDVTASKYFIGMGGGYNPATGAIANDRSYGFMIENGALFAFTANNSTYTKQATAFTFQSDKAYMLEARYYPGAKAVFYVSEPFVNIGQWNESVRVVERATVTSTLPTPAAISPRWMVCPSENVSKTMAVNFFEYIQKKATL